MRREAFEGAVLHLGDCLELMGDMAQGAADLVLTDPPYGIGYKPRENKKVPGTVSQPFSGDFITKK